MRIPPGLVAIALGRARTIFLKAIAVAVAVLVDPVEAAFRNPLEWCEYACVAEPAMVLCEQQKIEWRRVGGAVIRAMRNQSEMGPLANAELMWDLAWLCIAHGIVDVRLPVREVLQSSDRDRWLRDHRLHRRDQRIAAEQGHEPWQPSGRHPFLKRRVVLV